MARRKPSERAHGAHGDEEPLDLDVTPFLNILFMLILSILAMTSWTQLAMLNVAAPQIGGAGDGTGGATPPEATSTLNLTVFILEDGFNVGASGATLDGNTEGRSGEPLIPLVMKNGKPDGLKLYAIRPSSVFARLNFANGDTVHAINGHELTSADKALEVNGGAGPV